MSFQIHFAIFHLNSGYCATFRECDCKTNRREKKALEIKLR